MPSMDEEGRPARKELQDIFQDRTSTLASILHLHRGVRVHLGMGLHSSGQKTKVQHLHPSGLESYISGLLFMYCIKRFTMTPLELGQDKMLRDYRFTDINYQTSYGKAYSRKCDCSATTDKPSAPQTLKYKMIFNWADKGFPMDFLLDYFHACKGYLKVVNVPLKIPQREKFPSDVYSHNNGLKSEKVKLRNPSRMKAPEKVSEMKDKYKLHLSDETRDCRGILSNLRPHVLCNVSAVAADAQSKTSSEEQCIQKILDPYVSTQQYDFVYISTNEAAKYRHKKAEPVELIVRKKTPVYDENFLRLKFLDRFIRKKIRPVPHSGMTTEVRDNYRVPLDELAHKKNLFCSAITSHRLTKGEVMATPAMYHTDYHHYGHDWPLTSLL